MRAMRNKCCAIAGTMPHSFKQNVMKQTDIQLRIKEIKSEFRLRMNGVASASMRQKGVGGYLNWGIPFTELKLMAAEYEKDSHLAAALWKENVRECKILATLIMPAGSMDAEMAGVWMEQIITQEMAEYAAFNLFQYSPDASLLAYVWMASDKPLEQICGYCTLAGLFRNGAEPTERDINEFVDQAVSALADSSAGVRHAAMNCLNAFSATGGMQEKIVEMALRRNT